MTQAIKVRAEAVFTISEIKAWSPYATDSSEALAWAMGRIDSLNDQAPMPETFKAAYRHHYLQGFTAFSL